MEQENKLRNLVDEIGLRTNATPEQLAQVKELELEEKRLLKEASAKVVGLIMNDYPTLIIECPKCSNHEPYHVAELALERDTYLNMAKCIKCKQELVVGRRGVFKALADCEVYE